MTNSNYGILMKKKKKKEQKHELTTKMTREKKPNHQQNKVHKRTRETSVPKKRSEKIS